MSVTPSGKMRKQVAQGDMQNASIFDSLSFGDFAKKLAQSNVDVKDMDPKKQKSPNQKSPKDLQMSELQQTLNESNSLPKKKPGVPGQPGGAPGGQPKLPTEPEWGGAGYADPEEEMPDDMSPEMDAGGQPAPNLGDGSAFIDISKQISNKVIEALGLNKNQGESWQGKTEVTNDGNEVTGITIKLTRVMPNEMMMQGKVQKSGPAFGTPAGGGQGQPGQAPGGPVTNSV